MDADGTMSITVTENGPYRVRGSVPLVRQRIVTDREGASVDWEQGEVIETPPRYSLCRCGRSRTKPFCDSSHLTFDCDLTETASREPYLAQADEQDGPVVLLTDAVSFCASARFCDYGGQVWNLVERTDVDAATLAVREAMLCPSGRLVAWDRYTREPLEPPLERSIAVVEDPAEGVSGPLWVRGGIPVIAVDGFEYERRNRMTLCRCGASRNKPFCDGSHITVGFREAQVERE